MKNLVAISYKESSGIYSMSCLMRSFDSNFEIFSGEEDDVLLKIASLELKVEHGEGGYKHYFIIDNCLVSDEWGEVNGLEQYDSDEEYEKMKEKIDEEYARLSNKLDIIRKNVKQARDDENIKKNLKKQEEKKRIEQEKDLKKQEKDLKKLAELKNKYPDK